MIELTPLQRRALRADAHHLNPVVAISQKGLLPSVLTEIGHCLSAHQLIKVKLYGIDRESREPLINEICSVLNCALVQHIGNLLVLWRPADEITLPKSVAAGRRKAAEKPMTKKQAAARNEARQAPKGKTGAAGHRSSTARARRRVNEG